MCGEGVRLCQNATLYLKQLSVLDFRNELIKCSKSTLRGGMRIM